MPRCYSTAVLASPVPTAAKLVEKLIDPATTYAEPSNNS